LRLADLAARFDARNGNRYFAERLADLPRLKALAAPCLLEQPENRVP
jgi:hypothetical protein